MLLDPFDIGDLDLELLDAAEDIRPAVAAGIGADIVLVWRSGAATSPVVGGANVGRFGTKLSTGGETARPDQKPRLVGVYYSRITKNAGSEPQDFAGQLVDVLPFIFTFNENQSPDILGGDVITRAVKRRDNQTIGELGWLPISVYEVGSFEMPANLSPLTSPNKRRKFKVVTGGTSGAVEPAWTSTEGATVVDGSIVWMDMGRLDEYEVKDPGGRDTIPVERVVGCIEVQS